LALDLKDPRVVEGYRIALRAIQRMKERAEDKNMRRDKWLTGGL
jgi:hypothetical protein